MGAFVRGCLNARALVALVSVVTALFGAFALSQLPRELLPPIPTPELAVVTSFEGASAAVVDHDVSAAIEQAIRAVPGVASTTTTSGSGLSVVAVSFATGTEPAKALQQVQREIDSVRETLPGGADPRVRTGSIDDLPVMQAAVTAPDNSPPSAGIRARVLSDIGKLDGVRSATFIGAVAREISVDPRPDDLRARGLTGIDISRAILASGRAVSTGEVRSDDLVTPIESGRYLGSVEDVEQIPIGTPGGGTIALSDVADIALQDAPRRTIARVDGSPALLLSVDKVPEANTVEVARAIEHALGELEDDGVVLSSTTFNQAPAIEQAVGSTSVEGVIGLICAGLVVLLFLFSVRMTLIALISIPLSLLAAALVMQGLDYTLNLLTLGALTLAIGRLVDDSIVVVESVERELRTNADRTSAVVSGTFAVARAVLASTLTTVAVFFPLLFVGGPTGAMFRPFALTASVALLASLLVSLTVVPVLAFWLLRVSPIDPARAVLRPPVAERMRLAIERAYRPVARFSVRRAPVVLALGAVTVLVALLLVPGLPTSYLTGVGQSYVTVVQQERPDLAVTAQEEHAARVEKLLSSVDGVKMIRTSIGTSGNPLKDAALGGGAGLASYALTIDANADPAVVSADVQSALNDTQDLGTFSSAVAQEVGFASDIEVKVASLSGADLAEASSRISEAVAGVAGVHSVSDTSSPVLSSIVVDVDRAAARKVGLSEADVTAFLDATIDRREVMDATIDATLTPVVVEPAQPVASADEIEKLVVPSPRGSVALSEIAEVRYRDAPLVLQRSNGLDSGSVFVTLSGADIGGGAAAIAEVIDGLSLPTGTVSEVAGVAKDQSRAFTQLMFALGASVLIVYVIMVAAFRSLLQPLVLLVSVPFAVTGVIVAQRLWGGALGVSALIGALMLVGIAVTNAIVLVDRFNQLRAEGVSPDEAAVEGATARMRPVVMTAAATVLALGPMALGITGHGGLVAQPLAIVVIGGMASSTALTLMVLPALLSRAEALRSAGPGETRFSSGRHRVSPRRRRALVRRACFIYRGRGPDDSQKATGWRMRTAAGEYDLFLLHGAVLEESTVGMRISHREARRMLGVRFEEALGLMRGISVPVTPEKSAGARSHMQPVESGGQAPRQSSPDRAFADIEFVSDQSGQAIWAVLRETPVPQVEPSNFDEAAEEPERPGQSELLLRYEQESRHGLLFRLEGNEPILSMAPALVGRAPAEAAGYSAVHLPSPEKVVSRTHLLVEADALGRLCITDLDSANGTWADGRQLLPHLPTILPSGADIQIGESRMRVEVLAAAPSRAV
jgi:HAE1 family hydrophobic/amphiphilic exporter-1